MVAVQLKSAHEASMQHASTEAKVAHVPALRQELRLIPDKPMPDGASRWLIQDPISNKFYQIGWLEFELLSRWSLGAVPAILESIEQETTLHVDEDDIASLSLFLKQHHLLQTFNAEAVDAMTAQLQGKRQAWWTWLLHHYLFFRIPLIRPQAMLAKIRPHLSLIFQPMTAWTVLAVTITGLFLTMRQWDQFNHTLVDKMTWSGLLGYGLALIVSKTLHESGHALTATYYGVRVAHMGVAMLVMVPMPYTDTSESWKLNNPRQRLHIAAAGVVTELALAGFATLAWSICNDGALRDALFFLATTSWVLTLLVNLSPFMRFDGYFIFSDLINFPNLHERAGRLAKTWIRRTMLGFDEPYAEQFNNTKRNALITFALITWIYRLTVFLGIAWLVYTFFIKLIGIILFLVEILWFVVLPITNELKVWKQRSAEIKPRHRKHLMLLIVALFAWAMIPWQHSINATGWVYAERQVHLFTPIAGQIVSMHAAGKVNQGDILFTLTSPELAIAADRAKAISNARDQELRGLTGLEGGEAKRATLTAQREQYLAEVKLNQDELARMSLVAPMQGVLTDLNDNLKANTWVSPKEPLGLLIDPNSWSVDVFVDQTDIQQMQVGDSATIMLTDTGFATYHGRVAEIDSTRVSNLPHPMLAAEHGGELTTLGDKALTPKQALYRVHITFKNVPKDLNKVAVAHAKISTQAKAWLPQAFKHVAAIVIRESGF